MSDQRPLTEDQTFMAEIAAATHQAGSLPPQFRARALNAVGPALQARGEWLRLSSRQAAADAVLVALKPELDALARYENTINWHTTCLSCANVLTNTAQDTERADRAETVLARVHAARDRIAHSRASTVDAIYCLDLLDEALGITEQPGGKTSISVESQEQP